MDVVVDSVSEREALDKIRGFLHDESKQNIVVTINPEFIMASQRDESLKDVLNSSSLRLADGIGVLWSAKYLSLPYRGIVWSIWQMVYSGASLIFNPKYCRSPIPQRVSGASIVPKICEIAQEEEKSVFLLGGRDGSGYGASNMLQRLYPKLIIKGVDENIDVDYIDGDLIVSRDDSIRIVELLESARPDILFVALGGNQKQEQWISRYLSKAPGVKIAMGVGATFDFLSGRVKRAPKIFRTLGIEWLWRMFIQRRLSRIMTATVKFIAKVVLFKIEKGEYRRW